MSDLKEEDYCPNNFTLHPLDSSWVDKFHEWVVIENLSKEVSRTERVYGAYCKHCLKTKAVPVKIEG